MYTFTTIVHDSYERINTENKEQWGGIGEDISIILLFADDVVLLTESWEDMHKLLEEVGKFSEDMEMKFGLDKCKVMAINEKEEGNETNNQLQLLRLVYTGQVERQGKCASNSLQVTCHVQTYTCPPKKLASQVRGKLAGKASE